MLDGYVASIPLLTFCALLGLLCCVECFGSSMARECLVGEPGQVLKPLCQLD